MKEESRRCGEGGGRIKEDREKGKYRRVKTKW